MLPCRYPPSSFLQPSQLGPSISQACTHSTHRPHVDIIQPLPCKHAARSAAVSGDCVTCRHVSAPQCGASLCCAEEVWEACTSTPCDLRACTMVASPHARMCPMLCIGLQVSISWLHRTPACRSLACFLAQAWQIVVKTRAMLLTGLQTTNARTPAAEER